MASLTDIREGLAANLGVLKGVQVSAYVLGNATAPFIWVKPATDELVTYHQAMRDGLEHWHLLVEAYVGLTGDIAAQKKLAELVESTGPTSVKAAIESDKTLGGVAQDLVAENAHGFTEYTRADGVTLLGCRWNVLIYMNGG